MAKLNPQGTAIVYATLLGGSAIDTATDLAVDSTGAVYVTGTTSSSDFPVTTGVSKGLAFIGVLNPTLSALTYSARYPEGSVSQAIAIDARGRLHVAASTGLVSLLDLSEAPATRVFGITSVAGGRVGPDFSPGEVVSLVGTQLGPDTAMAAQASSDGRLPVALAGTQVLFDGIAAHLLSVSRDEINLVTPFALTPGKLITIRVESRSGSAPDFPGLVIPSRPTILRSASGAAVNQDGTINSRSNAARPGSVVTVWATGIGWIFPPAEDGQIATQASEQHCCSVYVSDKYAQVLYAGTAPGMVSGVVQINFRIPEDFQMTSAVAVSLKIKGSASQAGIPERDSGWIFLGP